MTRSVVTLVAVVLCSMMLPPPAVAQIVKKCPPDSVKVGNACVDR